MKSFEALEPLTGDYGHLQPGEIGQAKDDVADSLIERGLAKATSEKPDVKTEVVHQLHVGGETELGNPDNQEPLTIRGNEDLDPFNPDVSMKATEPAVHTEEKDDKKAAKSDEKTGKEAATRTTKEDKTVTSANLK